MIGFHKSSRNAAKCNVTGCKSGREMSEETIQFFHPPDQKTLDLWQKGIQGKTLKWKRTYSFCQKHFEDSDIIKHKTLQGIDGPVTVELNGWMLVNGAIPKLIQEPRTTSSAQSSLPDEGQSCSEFPSPNPASTKINPKEVSLPSSWYWQENCLEDDLFICSKFEWLNKRHTFEYIKSIIVKGNTIQYFVRGKLVVRRDLKTRFSTLNELATFLKLFDDAVLCAGITDPRSETRTLLIGIAATDEIRSKSCLLLARGNCCCECLKLFRSLKRMAMVRGKNTPKRQPIAKQNNPPIPEKVSNAPQQRVQLKTFQSTSKSPFSDITNHREEENVFTSREDQFVNKTNDQLIDISSSVTSVETTENHHCVPSSHLFNRNENNAAVDLTVLPDRETVTLQSTVHVVSNSDASVWDLEHRIIKRPSLKSFTKYPITLYHSQTWCYGVYSPFEPFAFSPEVVQCSADPYLVRDPIHVEKSIDLCHLDGSKTKGKVCDKLAVEMAKHLRPYLCDVCGQNFVHQRSLNFHLQTNHSGVKRFGRFFCTQCDYASKSKFGLQVHERTHTVKSIYCRYCGKKFCQKGAFNRHIRTHTETDGNPYACNICGTSYSTRSAYEKHYRKNHEKTKSERTTKKRRNRIKDLYRCEFCPEEFYRVLAFERHRASHTGLPVAVRCRQVDCDFTYSELFQLKDHMLNNHPETTFPCSDCSKIFLNKRYLDNHRSKHDDSLGFHCSYCPANLTTKASLMKHEKIHTRGTYKQPSKETYAREHN